MCSALTGAYACQQNSKCRWDTTVTATEGSDSWVIAHCTVACTTVVAAGTTEATIGGLTNGVWYRFTVTAMSSFGSYASGFTYLTGPHSTWDGNCVGGNNDATRAASGCTGTESSPPYWVSADEVHGGVSPGTVPSAPLAVTASQHPSGTAAIVSFLPPGDDGGHTIVSYTVTPYTDTSGTQYLSATYTGDSSPISVEGLVAGVTYYFKVLASNRWSGVTPEVTDRRPGPPLGSTVALPAAAHA